MSSGGPYETTIVFRVSWCAGTPGGAFGTDRWPGEGQSAGTLRKAFASDHLKGEGPSAVFRRCPGELSGGGRRLQAEAQAFQVKAV